MAINFAFTDLAKYIKVLHILMYCTAPALHCAVLRSPCLYAHHASKPILCCASQAHPGAKGARSAMAGVPLLGGVLNLGLSQLEYVTALLDPELAAAMQVSCMLAWMHASALARDASCRMCNFKLHQQRRM